VFRVGSLVVDAMRHLYRDVASQLSPAQLAMKAAAAQRSATAPR
jgi:hypothetical protein